MVNMSNDAEISDMTLIHYLMRSPVHTLLVCVDVNHETRSVLYWDMKPILTQKHHSVSGKTGSSWSDGYYYLNRSTNYPSLG